MRPDNWDHVAGLFNDLYIGDLPAQERGMWECAVQLAGIHDALIRLESAIKPAVLRERAPYVQDDPATKGCCEVTDTQLLTLALAVIVPLSLLIYSNTRITDAKESMNARLQDAKETLRAELGTVHAELAAFRAHMDLRFDVLLGKIEEIEGRREHR